MWPSRQPSSRPGAGQEPRPGRAVHGPACALAPDIFSTALERRCSPRRTSLVQIPSPDPWKGQLPQNGMQAQPAYLGIGLPKISLERSLGAICAND
jgi:hypothetical protein